MKQSTALWITNRTKELGRPFAIIVQTARYLVSNSTRPPCEQRTWILFSGKCEKKSAGNQLQTVPDWGTGILVLSVAAYTCASEPSPRTQGGFRKEGSCPNLSGSSRRSSRWESSQSFRVSSPLKWSPTSSPLSFVSCALAPPGTH